MADDEAFGFHLLCRLDRCALITMSEDAVMRFGLELAATIGMRVHSGPKPNPQCECFGGEPRVAGVTCVIPLDTSSIVIHCQDRARAVHLELWSCKKFDPDVVLDEARATFGGVVRSSRYAVV